MARACCFPFSRTRKFSLWVLTLDGKRDSAVRQRAIERAVERNVFSGWPMGRIHRQRGGGRHLVTEQRSIRAAIPSHRRTASSAETGARFPSALGTGRQIDLLRPERGESDGLGSHHDSPVGRFWRACGAAARAKALAAVSDVRGYDVLPDGRFIAVVPASEDGSGSAVSSEFRVVLNWFEELKRLAPVK